MSQPSLKVSGSEKPDTVYACVKHYQAAGFNGLFIRHERGRRPAYAAEHAEEAAARAERLYLIRRAPQQSSGDRSRWPLAGLRYGADWLKARALAVIGRLLERLDIHCKRGRDYTHSPDSNDDAKVANVSDCLGRAGHHPATYAVLLQDGLTNLLPPAHIGVKALVDVYQRVAQVYAVNGRA